MLAQSYTLNIPCPSIHPSYATKLTVNILGPVQVDAQDAAIRQGQDDDVVGNLRGGKVGGYGELQLHPLNRKDWQVAALQVRSIGGDESVVEIERHGIGFSSRHARAGLEHGGGGPESWFRIGKSRGEGVSVAFAEGGGIDGREIARLDGAWLKLEAGDGRANGRVVEMARLRQ